MDFLNVRQGDHRKYEREGTRKIASLAAPGELIWSSNPGSREP